MVRQRKQNLSRYSNDGFQKSILTRKHQVAAVGNWPKKIIRSLVFCLCLAGFIYQSLSFLWMYWEYQVTVDVRVSNPPYVHKPSFTICISNGFKATEFCEDPEGEIIRKNFSIYCEKNEYSKYYPDMCKCNPRVCDKYGNLRNISFLTNYIKALNLPRSYIKKWMLTPEEIMVYCYDIKMREGNDWLPCSDEYTVEIPSQFENYAPVSCFTLNSLIGRPNYTLEKVFTDSEIRLAVDLNEDLEPTSSIRNMLHISIHSPYTIINPFTHGFPMQAGYSYTFRMQKVVKKLLPHPYATDCKDYKSEWYARGGRGPTNLRECILECQKNISLAKYGCILRNIYISSEETICKSSIQDTGLYKEAMACSDEKCKPACEEELYTVTQTLAPYSDVNCYMNEYKERMDDSYIFIRLDGMETTSYIYSPKFLQLETFSYLGGYVGMWLGISLFAVFDFVETVFVMMKYSIRRFMHIKEGRRTKDKVQRIQRRLFD